MFKKFILIIFIIIAYIFLVSSDPKGNFINRIKEFYKYAVAKYNNMNLQYDVKTWPKKK